MPLGNLHAGSDIIRRGILVQAPEEMRFDSCPSQSCNSLGGMAGGDYAGIADNECPPGPHFRGELPQCIDFPRTEHDPGTRLEVEGRHGGNHQ